VLLADICRVWLQANTGAGCRQGCRAMPERLAGYFRENKRFLSDFSPTRCQT